MMDFASTKRKTDGVDGTDGKRARVEQPSKVLHVRGLGEDVLDEEVIAACASFGRVVNVLRLRGKGQAFVQMADVFAAANVVQAYTAVQPTIRGRPVFFQFSSRAEISAPNPGSHGPETPNHILLVTIKNPMYPITVDVIQQVFSKFGNLLKVIIFEKNGQLQALIQYSGVHEATAARTALEGQNIYAGCCTLQIQYSSLSELSVKYNNERSRDFTNPSLPTGSLGAQVGQVPQWQGQPGLQYAGGMVGQYGAGLVNLGGFAQPGRMQMAQLPGGQLQLNAAQLQLQQLQVAGAGGKLVLIVSNVDPEHLAIDELFVLFGVYGDVTRIKRMYGKPDTYLVQMASSTSAELAVQHLNGCPFRDRPLKVNFSKHQSISGQVQPNEGQAAAQLTKDFTGSPLHRYKGKPVQHANPPSQVLHLSNLPPGIDEAAITQLFQPYGTVTGFKFFATGQQQPGQPEKRMALLQMDSVNSAVNALIGVHNYAIETNGRRNHLRVSFSHLKLAN